MAFNGFTPRALALLNELPEYDREAFSRAAPIYRSEILEPAKRFVSALGPALRGTISSGIEFGAKTNESIAPIHNDLRFYPGTARYRGDLLFRFWEGHDRRWSPTLSVRVGSARVAFAAGMKFPVDALDRYRAAIDSDGDRLAKPLKRLIRYSSAEVVAPDLKRVPAPYPPDHPHSDLLRHKSLLVRWFADPQDSMSGPGLVTFCRNQLRKGAEVHLWLVDQGRL
jgi:uncharacterized protein (DUF2461 family)